MKGLEENPTTHDGNNTYDTEENGRTIMTRKRTQSSQQEMAVCSNLITSTTLGTAEGTPQQKALYTKGQQCDMKLPPKIKGRKERVKKRSPRRRNNKMSTVLNSPVTDERTHEPKRIKGMTKPAISENCSNSNAAHIGEQCLPKDAGMDPPTSQSESYGSQLDNTPPYRVEKAPGSVADALTDDHGTQEMAPKPPLLSSQVSDASPKKSLGAIGKASTNQGRPKDASLTQTYGQALPRFSSQHAVHMVGEENSQSIAVDLPDKNSLERIVDIVFNDHRGGIVRRRAILDTAASVNVISHEIVGHLGVEMNPWENGHLTTIGGPYLPIGEVTLDWHVAARQRTYRTLFAVIDPTVSDFDVLLGLETINRYKFLLRNTDVYFSQTMHPSGRACGLKPKVRYLTSGFYLGLGLPGKPDNPAPEFWSVMPRRKPHRFRAYWLRRDIPAERSGLTPMDSESEVDIVVYPEREEKAGDSIRAQADKGMRLSIISMGMLRKAQVSRYTTSDQKEVRGTDGKLYKIIGKVDLLWCKKNQAKSYPETFYVVENETPMVIMGAPSFSPEKRSIGQLVSPIGIGKQTPEQKKVKEQKAKEVEERREKERKEQEEKEKRKRDPK
ncbi:MAG: hypothetical protein Q9167_003376 [Letrouitia subvulpina]